MNSKLTDNFTISEPTSCLSTVPTTAFSPIYLLPDCWASSYFYINKLQRDDASDRTESAG